MKAGSVAGAPELKGRGIFAEAVVKALPDLPVEESGRLNDVILRENFVTRTFAYAHWQRLLAAGLSAGGLIAFHSRYKYLLMAHSVPHYQQAGRLLSDLSDALPERAQRYISTLMAGLTKPATRNGHANVLSHLQGYLKRSLDGPLTAGTRPPGVPLSPGGAAAAGGGHPAETPVPSAPG